MQDAIKTIISIGLNDKDEHIQLLSLDNVKRVVIRLAHDMANIDNMTFVEVQGVWNGELENTLQVIIILNQHEYKEHFKDNIRMFVSELRDVLNQQCIMVETQVIEYVEFI